MRPTLELWQTEWCPASHRVRQRLTELGLSYIVHQVPVDRAERAALKAATGEKTIPALMALDAIVIGEAEILDYLAERFADPPGAVSQREKADKAKRKELEEACPKFTAPTH